MRSAGTRIALTGMTLLLLGCTSKSPPVDEAVVGGMEGNQAELKDGVLPGGEPSGNKPAAEPNPCLDCHSDQQLLIETARPEEATPEESSGVG